MTTKNTPGIRGNGTRFAFRSGKMKPAVLMTVAGLVLVGGVSAAVLIGMNRRPSLEESLGDADRAIAKRMSFEITTVSNGELEARNRLEVRSQLEAQAAIQFIVPEGTRAKEGEVIVRLNTDKLQSEIDQERPRLASARAELVAAENAYQIRVNDNASAVRKAELNVELRELDRLQWLEGDVSKRRQDLDTKIATAELELERLATKFTRSQELLREGFLSKNECDLDEVQYIKAISEYQTTRLTKEVYELFEIEKDRKQKESDVEEAKRELNRVQLNNEIELASASARKSNQQEQVAISEARLKKLTDQFASCEIKAATDGLVVYASSVEPYSWQFNNEKLQIGTNINPNQVILILPDTREMVASVRVHESMAGRLRSRQRVSVKVDAAGGRIFEGAVDSIGVMAESGGWRDPNLREYIVKVRLVADGDAQLKPAMRAEARIILDSVEDALTVPVQALFSEGAVNYVLTPRGNKVVKVPVHVGRRSDTTAEILKGVEEQTIVLVRDPNPTEILSQKFDPADLAKAGYTVGENGDITPPADPFRAQEAAAAAAAAGGGGSAAGGGRPGGGRPGGPAAGARPGAGGSRPAGSGGGGGGSRPR